MTFSFARAGIALAATALVGCVTADPRGAFDATRGLTAGRHPGDVVWLRDPASRDAAEARARELLATPLDAAAAAELALLRSPSLQARLEELGIGQAALAQASRLANPGLTLSRLSGDGETRRSGSLVADLVDWIVQPLRRRLAEAELERTKLEVAQAILETASDAERATVGYQAALLLVDRLTRTEELARTAADYADALHAAGNLTAVERARLEAEWAESRAERRRAEAEATALREALARAVGLDGSAAWEVTRHLDEPSTPAVDAAALADRAVAERLDLAAARWAVDVLERALALRSRTRLMPLGVELGIEREREIEGITVTGPVVELRLPLFDTGKASVALLEGELARARWQLAALEAEVRSTVRERAAELAAAHELHAWVRDRLLPLRLEVLDGTLREHNQMLIGTFELLHAKERQVEAERQAVESLAAYWEAWIELERAVGAPLPPPSTESPENQP